MSDPLRADLIPALCTYLPVTEGSLLALLDPTDFQTHVEVYVAVRRNEVQLPYDLLRDFVAGLLVHMDNSFLTEPAIPRDSTPSARVFWLDRRRTNA